MSVLIQVSGTPRPQPRPRAFRNVIVSVADKNAKMWIAQIKAEVSEAMALNGVAPFEAKVPIKLEFLFIMPIKSKKRWGMHHTNKPDIDNLIKLPMDVINKCGLIHEDAQVCGVSAAKVWGESGGMAITIKDVTLDSICVPTLVEKKWFGG